MEADVSRALKGKREKEEGEAERERKCTGITSELFSDFGFNKSAGTIVQSKGLRCLFGERERERESVCVCVCE